MFDMADATLDIHTLALVESRKKLAPLEEESKRISKEQIENQIAMIEEVEKAWSHRLQQLFPGVPMTDRHCVSEITPQDPLNKAAELPAMLAKIRMEITEIEHDVPRNTYRLYGRKSYPPVAPGIPIGKA